MIKFQPGVSIRVAAFAMCLALIGLVAACAPSFGAAPSDTSAATAVSTTAPAAATTSPAAAPSTAASTPAAAPATASSATAAPVDTAQTVRLEFVSGDNTARYRVREQLASLSFPSDAVGTTKAVTGTIVANADGTFVSSVSKVQVDLSTLTSDQNQRDNFIKRSTLQTNTYRYAVFVPTAIQGLTLPPTSGPVSFKLIGDLTIRNVTKQVTWDVTGTINGNDATGTATTSFNFAYFNLTKPSVGVVLSVEDNITLEMDLHLRRVVTE